MRRRRGWGSMQVQRCWQPITFQPDKVSKDDHMNILCMGGRTVGPEAAWDLVQTYISSEYSQAPRHLRRLGKVAALEQAKLEEVKKSNCL